MVLIEAQQWDRARADIEQLRRRISKSPRIDYAEGLLHYRQQNYADAARLFEAALAAFPGAIIAVSHDRHFLAHFAEEVWTLRNGQLKMGVGQFPQA